MSLIYTQLNKIVEMYRDMYNVNKAINSKHEHENRPVAEVSRSGDLCRLARLVRDVSNIKQLPFM